MGRKLKILKFLRINWKTVVLIGTPIFFAPLTFTRSPPLQCTYIIAIVGIYWITEVMNVAITSLIPILLFPLFGLLEPKDVVVCYMKDITLMLLGGLIVAKTIEKQNLHKRMALHILNLMGPNLIFQYLGFMLSTWFISMWINNSSTTAMMVTIANAVTDQWVEMATARRYDVNRDEDLNANNVDSKTEFQRGEENTISTYETDSSVDKEIEKMEYVSKGLILSIAYSATTGGIATISGTVPNYIFYEFMDIRYGSRLNLNFGTFMMFSFPVSLLFIILCWTLLIFRYIGSREIFNKESRQREDDLVMEKIRGELESLGQITYGEISTLIVFLGLVSLWILREPGVPLLSRLFTYKIQGKKIKFWTDGSSAVLASLFVFNLPSKNPFKYTSKKEIPKLMSWQYLESGFSWGIVFLFGGGFAIAAGCETSGLSKIIGEILSGFSTLPHLALILIISLGISFLTEITSNVVTVTIMLPILIHLAECIDMHPMRMGLAVCLSSSLSFCLPASTIPNAIIFSTGKIQVIDMLSTGFMLNFICVIVLSLMAYYYSCPIFKSDIFPSWIKVNCTYLDE